MERIAEFLSRIKIEYRRSRPLTKIVAVAAIALSMVALLTLSWAKHDVQRQTQEMMGEAARLEHENAQLEQKIDALGSIQSAEQIAQEELGMVSSDTVLIDTE